MQGMSAYQVQPPILRLRPVLQVSGGIRPLKPVSLPLLTLTRLIRLQALSAAMPFVKVPKHQLLVRQIAALVQPPLTLLIRQLLIPLIHLVHPANGGIAFQIPAKAAPLLTRPIPQLNTLLIRQPSTPRRLIVLRLQPVALSTTILPVFTVLGLAGSGMASIVSQPGF